MIFFRFNILVFFLIKVSVQVTNAQSTDLSTRIAQKLQDTLGLSTVQRDSIYAINIRLQNQKSQARSRYTGTDSLQYHIQRIENTRDSLYKGVIVDDNKYGLYKQKKRYLVSNN